MKKPTTSRSRPAKRPPILLFCRCAQAQVTPTSARQRVAEELASRGATVEAVDDLCGLAARRDAMLARLAGGGPLRIVACHPRAVRWLFAAAGAALPEEDVEFFNLRTQSAEDVLERLATDESNSKPVSPASVSPAPAIAIPAAWVPWFPVIDYDRCTGCRQCLQFCLFGVYGEDDGRVCVVQPSHCKTGCPACARMCPSGAIIFPKYTGGLISGDDSPPDADPSRPVKPIDFSSLEGLDLREAIRRRQEILKQHEGRRHG